MTFQRELFNLTVLNRLIFNKACIWKLDTLFSIIFWYIILWLHSNACDCLLIILHYLAIAFSHYPYDCCELQPRHVYQSCGSCIVVARVHNIYREGECLTTYVYTLQKRTAASNTSKLLYTLGFNLRIIMDDVTVNR